VNTYPVWDAPSRLIHWCFPVGVGLMWWTGETGRMELHSYVAYVLLILVITRLALGFVGSYHSRFRNFVVGPKDVFAYLREGGQFVGHNPLGALSTLALLLLVLAQGLSGLFSVDDVSFDGPLAFAFDGRFIDLATEWHDTNWSILQLLIFMHLAAIAWYQWRKRQPMVQTMWRGQSANRVSEHAPVHVARAVAIAVIVAACLWLAITWAPEAPSYY
jgi:cytochrome b